MFGLWAMVACEWGAQAPEPLVPGPEIALIDQTGAAFGDAQLGVTPWVANVIFTRCPTICPASTARMMQLDARTKDLGGEIAFLSFSVDPAYDTPDVLTAYIAETGADAARWHFLTGEVDEVNATVMGGLKLAVQQGGGDPSEILHGTRFVLGAQRQLYGFYDTEVAAEFDQLEADLRALAKDR